MNRTVSVLAVLIGIAGTALVVWKAGAWPAIGVLLMIWGNNLERSGALRRSGEPT